MSALALKLPLEEATRPPRRRLVPVARPATLDGVLSLAWTAVSAGHPAECPVCSGTLSPSREGGGTCGGCGASLA